MLAETGLLDGREATSHWGYEDLFRRHYPKVKFRPEPNLAFADPAGRIVTAGGTTSWHCGGRRFQSERSGDASKRRGIRAAASCILADDRLGLGPSAPLIFIEYIQTENRMLRARLSGKRIQFSDAERALLARKAEAVGRKALALDTIVSPDTLMRWHRCLVAQKRNFSKRRGPGRPGVMREISQLIVRMAQENPGWGYTRIQGALANLSHQVGRGTVSNVLKRNGIEPAPERGKRTAWSTFLRAHWKVLAASDFFTVEV
jgi:hypothetical protein